MPDQAHFHDVLDLEKDSPEVELMEQLESYRRLGLTTFMSNYIDVYSVIIADIISKILLDKYEANLDEDDARSYTEEREDIIKAAIIVFSAHMLRSGMLKPGIYE